MDPSAFDTLVRAFASGGTRRRLLRLVAALPIASALLASGDAASAERPLDRLRRRTEQRNRKQRNTHKRQHDQHHQHHQHDHNHNNTGGGGNPGPCTPNGQACTESGQCCSDNCFNFVCTATVTQCAGQPAAADGTGHRLLR